MEQKTSQQRAAAKNRLQQLFASDKKNLLSIYYTAGYPSLNDTLDIAVALEAAGADFLEIGFPYSDPVADGPVIQQSSKQALDNGMTLALLFEQLRELRQKVGIPVLLMGYINVVLQYGVEAFCIACREVGIDGCIIPDLPLQEYETLYQHLFEENGISFISLVSPQTSEVRIRQIDAASNAFIYLVSSAATTGGTLDVTDGATRYFKRIQDMGLSSPQMIGFGIAGRDSFEAACQYARGAIIGSAFVKSLEKGENLIPSVQAFMRRFK